MSQRRIKGLGEVALHVHDLDAVQRFYEQVIGLEVLRREEQIGTLPSRRSDKDTG
jgi:catechol-2,3-dioxygenase